MRLAQCSWAFGKPCRDQSETPRRGQPCQAAQRPQHYRVETTARTASLAGQSTGILPLIVGTSPFGTSSARALQPTPYRYSALIDRAKQLVTIAQQVEATFLATLEKRDVEEYNLLKASQDLGSGAGECPTPESARD